MTESVIKRFYDSTKNKIPPGVLKPTIVRCTHSLLDEMSQMVEFTRREDLSESVCVSLHYKMIVSPIGNRVSSSTDVT